MPSYAEPTPSPSPSRPTCQDVIGACDKALADKNAAIAKKNEAIESLKGGLQKSEELLGKTIKQKEEAEREKNAWYRSPIPLIMLGIIGGILIPKH